MRRILLDSNAVDPFVDLQGAYEAAERAISAGSHQLIFTHITVDELAEIHDLDRRQHLLIVLVALGRLVPTGAAAVGYSRLNFCRISDDEDVFEAIQSGSLTHTRDALLAATALFENCPIATNDRQLRARALRKGVEAMGVEDLLLELGYELRRGSTNNELTSHRRADAEETVQQRGTATDPA